MRSFSDAESALEAVKENPPDLVLMDIGLPGMSGIEGIRAVKAIRPEMPVIVITGDENLQTVVSAMKNGAFDYVVKPLSLGPLKKTIEDALDAVRLRKVKSDIGGIASPALTDAGVDLATVRESVEKHYIGEALRISGGNETKAARILNVNYHTFRYRRRRLGL